MHAAVDALGHLLALKVTAANEQDRAQGKELAQAIQAATGENVQLAYGDQGYTGEPPASAAAAHGMKLEVVKHHEARRGFVLLPRRWVVERTFAWAARFRRWARDHERLAATWAGYHWLAVAMRAHLSLSQAGIPGVAQVSQPAVSPTSSRLAHARRGRPGIRRVCGLEIRDPADWKSALRHRPGAPCKKMRCALAMLMLKLVFAKSA